MLLHVSLGLFLLPFGLSPPLYFRQPLGWPASSFALSNRQALQHQDRLGDLISLRPKVGQHFIDIHFSSVP